MIEYWYRDVLVHFIVILLVSFLCLPQWSLCGWFIAGVISFPVLFMFIYLPVFLQHFSLRPLFNTPQVPVIEKCRKQQAPNLTLCLMMYALDNLHRKGRLQPCDHTAALLNQLFGVDTGSLKKNLVFILSPSSRMRMMSERQRTELRNRFEEARILLNALHFEEAVGVLQKLELKLMQTSSTKKL